MTATRYFKTEVYKNRSFCTIAIAASGVEDVRDVLDYYNKETDPLEAFKINQVKLQVIIFL
jgi:hypothetical protein